MVTGSREWSDMRRCPHGAIRGEALGAACAGRIMVCTCCESKFCGIALFRDALDQDGYKPTECHHCRAPRQ